MSGLGVVEGVALGRAHVLRATGSPDSGPPEDPALEQERAATALARLAEELERSTETLRALGHPEEAAILDTNRLMALDPGLANDVRTRAASVSASAAVLAATEERAQLLDRLSDPMLAARSADVRAIGRRAANLLEGRMLLDRVPEGAIVVARDLGPADVAEIGEHEGTVSGIALVDGAVMSHAAIMARSLDVPMVVALGPDLLAVEDGEELYLDGARGTLWIRPDEATASRARELATERARRREQRPSPPSGGLVTAGGRPLTLLCNASTPAEVAAGLAAGAEGVGLIRTELAFMDAEDWPGELECTLALQPLLEQLAGHVATVRVFDFGGDKTPPFLAGTRERGIGLLLGNTACLSAQINAVLHVGAPTRLRIMAPFVQSPEQLASLRAVVDSACDAFGWQGPHPPVGAMIETPQAVARVDEIAALADFLSIGTNDLVQYTLGLDRTQPDARLSAAGDPRVLRLIARIVDAAASRSIPTEICGEAAGEPSLATVFAGLGVDELSVVPSRIGPVREAILAVQSTAPGGIHGDDGR